MQLRTKMAGMVATLIVLMFVIVVVSLSSLWFIGKEITGIAERDIPLIEVITAITTRQLEQELAFGRAIVAAKTNDKIGLRNAGGDFRDPCW